MKKFIATFIMMAVMAVMIPLTVTTVDAQTRKPSIYKRHRNLINIGIGTGGSAIYTYKINPKTGRYYRVRR